MSDPVLQTLDLSVRFGGVVALDSVSLACERGHITGLIGPNGAGKTTFVDAVCGFLRRNASGRVLLDGVDIGDLPPHRRAHLGVSRTWQSVDLFDDLDIRGNLEVAAGGLTFGRAVRELVTRRRPIPAVEQSLELMGMQQAASKLPSEMSPGDRKIIGLGRAAVSAPKLLILDEPAAGLDRAETRDLADGLAELRDRGNSILLIDHDMSLVLSLCDRVHVLDLGRLIASSTPDDIRTDPAVIRAYLGGTNGVDE